MRRALLIMHDHLSPADPLVARLTERGYAVAQRLVVPGERHATPDVAFDFPDPRDWDLIIPLGSPWAVDDLAAIGTWVTPELAMLRKAHEAGVPVLGVCFGGQALAAALGGGVERSPRPELGWVTVETDDPALVGPGPWFQFHYDRWILPPGAVEIARNGVCSQAFTVGRSMGVQFHPEINVPQLENWLVHGGADLVRAAGRDPDAMLESLRRDEAAAIGRCGALVDAFLERVAV
ncbi:type 1 glutamine amidotransferase [Actinomadura namibiensis]|uniref:GMP synthase-like glutamine amidotransferase n=1 Tax=Actinomadura namibiensis TaxID=182080 RepID=A0A7W3LMK4_ACTNM|nr:type 1 glutamine amidotransferase [Actinomadura namibiensis]MBA8950915.1 GMP synthase-like glutamine amidotransferase [Actinomadura namibiensis]